MLFYDTLFFFTGGSHLDDACTKKTVGPGKRTACENHFTQAALYTSRLCKWCHLHRRLTMPTAYVNAVYTGGWHCQPPLEII